MKVLRLALLSIATLLVACTSIKNLPETNDPYFEGSFKCYGPSERRIGALCHDKTYSKSKGSGTCSYHGGVMVWLCK